MQTDLGLGLRRVCLVRLANVSWDPLLVIAISASEQPPQVRSSRSRRKVTSAPTTSPFLPRETCLEKKAQRSVQYSDFTKA